MNATAEITALLPVTLSEEGRRLTIDIPNGWDDVKKVCKKVLHCGGRHYTFIGWNSDSLKCYFTESKDFATIGKKVR